MVLEEVSVMKLRIKFAKFGSVKFIGHLDIMRYFQKAIRRAQLDIVFTEGYSPHQIMSFAAPLGVGLESKGEYMDIEVDSANSSQEIIDALNHQMAEGITILSVRKLPLEVKNAMASVAAARYLISFRPGKEPNFNWKPALSNFSNREKIVVTKKTKKSEKEFDLKPFIFELSSQGNSVEMLVDASSSGNIKPSLVLEAFYKENGQVLGQFDYEITRLETYALKGQELSHQLEENEINNPQKVQLISLEEMGNLF